MRPQPVFKSELDSYVPSEEEIIKNKIENNHIWQQLDEEEKLMEQERESDPFESFEIEINLFEL